MRASTTMHTHGSAITLLLTSFLALAVTVSAPLSAATKEPDEIVQETSDHVLELINNRGEELENDPEARMRLIDEIILPIIDFPVFSQLVLATDWRTATPEQRTQFMGAFKSMMARTYTKSLSDYAGTRFNVLPARGEQREDYRTVNTEIRTGQGLSPLRVDYSFRFNEGQWKVYDLVIDGLSLVKNFRSSFGNEINRNGLDALITRLKRGGEGLTPQGAAP
ncbi:MAG: ABC transporter substrate-binding protein [Gammaproteobacteria bacterium]|nr:ABC transporter substrate-binding protein [Gammaproteobacteria bacterium]